MELNEEYVEAAKAHDARVRAIAESVEIEIGTRDGQPLNLLLKQLGADADAAMVEFAYADLSDLRKLQDLQSRVFRIRVAFDTFNTALLKGQQAEREVREADYR